MLPRHQAEGPLERNRADELAIDVHLCPLGARANGELPPGRGEDRTRACHPGESKNRQVYARTHLKTPPAARLKANDCRSERSAWPRPGASSQLRERLLEA